MSNAISRRFLCLSLMLVAVGWSGSLNLVNAAGTKAGRAEGTISAVNLTTSTVGITTQQGTVVQVKVTSATKIERNGRRVPLSGLRIGDRGQARFDAATSIATKVESVGP